MYTVLTRLCKCSCKRPHTRPVVYMAGRPTGPCTRSQMARYRRVRPVTAVYTARSQPVHSSVYGRVRRLLHGCPTRAYVYNAVKRPCTRYVHGPRRHVTAVGRVHGRNTPCTRSRTRPIQSTCSSTRAVNTAAYTAVACRLGTCTRSGRPTCRIHGSDGPCTRPCNGRVHGPLHGRVRAV